MRFEVLNRSNLWSLYTAIGTNVKGCRLYGFPEFAMVLSNASVWPNCVFDIRTTDRPGSAFIDGLHDSISALGTRALIISADNPGLDLSLRESPYHYYPIEQWTGMHRSIARNDVIATKRAGCEPTAVGQADLAEWVAVVSDTLFNGKGLDIGIFSHLLAAGQTLIALKNEGMIIGSALVFVDPAGIAGIYMFCVKKEFRRQGFGKVLLDYCLDRIRLSGGEICILQSTRAGLRLYEKAGFSNSNLYSLFWKIK